jgi:hypothetical protein
MKPFKRFVFLCLFVSTVLCAARLADAPVFVVLPVNSWIKFDVDATVDIAGKFDKWDATLRFTSPDETTGVLEIKIQADSVDKRIGRPPRTHLDEDARRSICKAYAMGGASLRQLAVRFGTSIGTVQRCIQLYQKASHSRCYPLE